MKNRLLFLGPPGAGKGTQAARICDSNGMKHLSTGDLLRSEVAAGSELGKEAEAVMNRGELVSDQLVLAIVESQMKALSGEGWLLDGFPRTVPQAEALEPLLNELKQPIEAVVLLELDDAVFGHDTPWCKGGRSELSNGAMIRAEHNRDMGTVTLDEYRLILSMRNNNEQRTTAPVPGVG